MTQAKLVHLDKDNADFSKLAIVDLEIIPRIGESVYYAKSSDDDPVGYTVDNVVHSIQSERPLEIWLVTPQK
ncbi:MAG TPA: hypothetical protein VKQ52_05905 [Puia sp.]|nr:hypothetical protein [Puia sp.]